MNRARGGEANRGNEAVPVEKGVTTPAGSRKGSPSTSAETAWTDVLISIIQDPERVRGLHGLLGPYCHQSRNLLNGLKIGLYIARSKDRSCGDRPEGGSPWDELDRLYQAVEQRFD